MIPRQRLDIGWSDLGFGVRACFRSEPRQAIASSLEQQWSATGAGLACLSVRSGFDALLAALNFPAGSEILVSAITIRGMIQIIEAHGLVPMPIDLDMARLAVCPESLARAATERTCAILVAHLFGSRMPMEPILDFARDRQLRVIEDCAQAYTGDDDRGHPGSDVSLFSFGPIKTATALAGGMLHFRDPALRQVVAAQQASWPVQSRGKFLRRLGKYALLMLLSERWVYRLFGGLCNACRVNPDRLINQSVRGFGEADFFRKIRQQPSAVLLALLERRLQNFGRDRITQRIQRAEQLLARLPGLQRPGTQAAEHSHWVFPIQHAQPERLRQALWQQGFDATQGGSSLFVVAPPTPRPEMPPQQAAQVLPQLLYLPLHAGMSSADIERLAQALEQAFHEADRTISTPT